MSLFPHATWKGPVPNCYGADSCSPIGLVLHIMQSGDNGCLGTAVDGISGCDSWFHNPASQVSAHFGTGTEGELWQWVDTDQAAWAEVAGNGTWLSIENSGNSGDKLLDSQVASCAAVLAWAHQEYGIEIRTSDDPLTGGLGWHGMGGQAWGDHIDCPGQPVVDQRAEIIAQAVALVGPKTSSVTGLRRLSLGDSGPDVVSVQTLLNQKAGSKLAISGIFDGQTRKGVKAWTQFLHIAGSPGYVGDEVWWSLIAL